MKLDTKIFSMLWALLYSVQNGLPVKAKKLKTLYHTALFLFVHIKLKAVEHEQSYFLLAKLLEVFVFILKNVTYSIFCCDDITRAQCC